MASPDHPERIARFLRNLAQLRIRDLIFLTTIAAIFFAWSQDHARWERELAAAKFAKQDPMWQTFQVFGEPNTTYYGDVVTAWASSTQDGQKEWLDLNYAATVVPKEIWIYETYNPGAVYKVSIFDPLGREVTVWKGTDPLAGTSKIGIAKIPVPKSLPTKRVKVYIDSPAVAGWNEIDAVGIRDKNGRLFWAASGKTSSSYGGD